MVLRNASGLVVDSLNYGGLVDPWAAEGYRGTSGPDERGCYAASPGAALGFGSAAAAASATNTSAGRLSDGVDSDSNCNDFLTQAATTLTTASAPDAANIKVASVKGFNAGQKVMIDTGTNRETAVIATVGTAGSATVQSPTSVGVTMVPVENAIGLHRGETITIGSGANSETAVIAATRGFRATAIDVASPLTHAHAAGEQVSGSGITLTTALRRPHAKGVQISDNVPTPGEPNHYDRTAH